MNNQANGPSKRTASPIKNLEGGGLDKQQKPLLSGNKSVRTNEDDEDYQNKTMGSEMMGVLKLNSGELIERSIAELSINELLEEKHLNKISLMQLINRMAEAKYRFEQINEF